MLVQVAALFSGIFPIFTPAQDQRLFDFIYEATKKESDNYINCISSYNIPISKSNILNESIVNSLRKSCVDEENQIRKIFSIYIEHNEKVKQEIDWYINVTVAKQLADTSSMDANIRQPF